MGRGNQSLRRGKHSQGRKSMGKGPEAISGAFAFLSFFLKIFFFNVDHFLIYLWLPWVFNAAPAFL